ncbi:hypothetical protein PENANT_c001G00480 [Penicillium antarcticum]|uniref:Uncharacterized protein n=1 Tax=Penicillium antarcticum TaxID=416450 RepID=A0A1V6QMT5_9EURO|nr:hypothetical protein PENANT_c001G00480 [Penicillium antarcticum]
MNTFSTPGQRFPGIASTESPPKSTMTAFKDNDTEILLSLIRTSSKQLFNIVLKVKAKGPLYARLVKSAQDTDPVLNRWALPYLEVVIAQSDPNTETEMSPEESFITN